MPIPLYPQVVVENSLSPAHGGAEIDDNCQQIYEATKGWGVSFFSSSSFLFFSF